MCIVAQIPDATTLAAHIIMAALCNRASHYIFALWYFLSFYLLSFLAVADWMTTILAHMVWPLCEFKMQV